MALPPQDDSTLLAFFVASQLKYGCGDPSCANPHCRSSPNFRHAELFTALQGCAPAEANREIAQYAAHLYDQNKGSALCLPGIHQTLAMWITAIDVLPNSTAVPLNYRCWNVNPRAMRGVMQTTIQRIADTGLDIRNVVDPKILQTTVRCNLTNFDALRRFCQYHSKEYLSLECDFDSPCFSDGVELGGVGRSSAFLERLYADIEQNRAFYNILLAEMEREAGGAGPKPPGQGAGRGGGAQSAAAVGPIYALLQTLTQAMGDISTLFDVEPDIACEPKHVPVFVLLVSLPEKLFLSFPGFFQNVCKMIRALNTKLKVEFLHLMKQYCDFLNRKRALLAAEFVHQIVSLCQSTLTDALKRGETATRRSDAIRVLGERETILSVLDLLTVLNHINVRGRRPGANIPLSQSTLGVEALRVFSPDMVPVAKNDRTAMDAIEDAISQATDPHAQVPIFYVSQREFENPFLDSTRYNYGPDVDFFLHRYRRLTTDGLLPQLAAAEPVVVKAAREAEEARRRDELSRRAARGGAQGGARPARPRPDSDPAPPVARRPSPPAGSAEPGSAAFGDLNSIVPDALSTDQSEPDEGRGEPFVQLPDGQFVARPLVEHLMQQLMGVDDRARGAPQFPAQMFTFLQYPFILSAAVKAEIFRFECTPARGHFQHPIFISRNSVVNDTLGYIIGNSNLEDPDSWRSKAHQRFLRFPLNVTFDAEEGVDQGGLRTEFFNLLCDELFSQKYGLFECNEESKAYYWKKRPDLNDRDEAERLYCFAGMVFAMCMLNQVNVNNVFPHVFYKKLLGDLGSLEDLAGLDPALYSGLCRMWHMGRAALAAPGARRAARPSLSFTAMLPSSRRVGKAGDEHRVVIAIPDKVYDLDSDPIYTTFGQHFTAPEPQGVLGLYDTLPGSAVRGFVAPGAGESGGGRGAARGARAGGAGGASGASGAAGAAGAAGATGPAAASGSSGPSGSGASGPSSREVELVPGGANIPVCLLNFEEYIAVRTDYEVNASVAVQFQNFQDGFLLVAGSKALTLFNSSDLEVSIVGEPTLDFEALRRVTTYEEPFSASHQVVRWFWDVVINDLDEEERIQLLKFVTGSARAPVGGLGKLPFRIFPNGDGDNMLPTSHTCFNVLMLPQYSSREVLRSKLRTAITHCEGFGLK